MSKDLDKSNWITFRVEPIDKSLKPFNLSSLVLPQPGYTLKSENKIYRVTGVFMDFDGGAITVLVAEFNPILKPKLVVK